MSLFFFFKESEEYLETTLLVSPSRFHVKKKSRGKRGQKMGMHHLEAFRFQFIAFFFPRWSLFAVLVKLNSS